MHVVVEWHLANSALEEIVDCAPRRGRASVIRRKQRSSARGVEVKVNNDYSLTCARALNREGCEGSGSSYASLE